MLLKNCVERPISALVASFVLALRAFLREFVVLPASRVCVSAPCADTTTNPTHCTGTATAIKFRMRTRLYAAQVKANIQSKFNVPRCRTLRNSAIVLSQPKLSSMRLLFL